MPEVQEGMQWAGNFTPLYQPSWEWTKARGGYSNNQQLKRGLQQPVGSVNWAECQSLDYYYQLHTWRLPVQEYSSWFSTENARKQKQRDKRTRIKNMTEMYNNIPAPDYMKQLAKIIGMD